MFLLIVHMEKEINSGHSTSSSIMGPLLKEEKIWLREDDYRKEREKQSIAVNYHRDFMSKWIELGWVEKDKLRKKDIITEKGMNILNTFYVE